MYLSRELLQSSTPAFRYLDAAPRGVVVADEDAPGLGHEPITDAQLELELEALRADPGRSHADRDGLAEADLRAEVDLRPGEDHVSQRHRLVAVPAEPGESRLLDVHREDGVVDMTHAVEVAEASRLVMDEREALHLRRSYRRGDPAQAYAGDPRRLRHQRTLPATENARSSPPAP